MKSVQKIFAKIFYKMRKYFLFLVILAKFAVIYGFNENRIYNGEITPSDLFQFAVQLRSPGSMATGSIISKRHILTCAHFIYAESEIIQYDTYKVYLGIPYHADIRPNSSDGEMRSPNSTKAYLPKTSTWSQWPWNDIAILEFPEGTDFGIEPVKLAKDYREKEGDEAYIIGFGAWWKNGTETSGGSDVLRHAKITMVTDCYETLKICGGDVTHLALSGDSGGPMVINRNNQWYQIGVSSSSGNYDIRTRVSAFCNFIEEATKNEVKCESIFPEKNNLPVKIFEPIYKGQSTSTELFNFVVPLYNYYYNQGCTATVISKRHLLTSRFCIYRDWRVDHNKNYAVQLTEYLTYKTVIGKLFPDFRTKNIVHSNFKNDPINVTAYFPLKYDSPWDHNIAVIEYPKGTDFGIEPVSLAKDYIPIYLDNSTFIIAGYRLDNNIQHIEEPPPILLHDYASPITTSFDNIGTKNENLTFAEGAPMLFEKNGKFYLLGVHFVTFGTQNGPFSSVPRDCEFIEEVTKNEVQCESTAPIYEQPTSTRTTKIFPQKQELIALNPQSSSPKIKFEMILFIIFVILFCL